MTGERRKAEGDGIAIVAIEGMTGLKLPHERYAIVDTSSSVGERVRESKLGEE